MATPTKHSWQWHLTADGKLEKTSGVKTSVERFQDKHKHLYCWICGMKLKNNLIWTLSYGRGQCEIVCLADQLHSDYPVWVNRHKYQPKDLSLSEILFLFFFQKRETVLHPEPPGPIWTHSQSVYVSSFLKDSLHIPKDCSMTFWLWRGSCCSMLSCYSCSRVLRQRHKRLQCCWEVFW